MTYKSKTTKYKQDTEKGVIFSESINLNGNTYAKRTNINNGRLEVLNSAGNTLVVFNGETNNWIPSADDTAVEKLRTDIGGRQKLDNLKRVMIQDTIKLGNELLTPANKTAAGIADGDFSQEINNSRNDLEGYNNTVNASDEVNSADLQNGLTPSIQSQNFGQLSYPSTLGKGEDDNKNKQDYIKFTIGEYKVKKLDNNKKPGVLGPRDTFKSTSGTIYLPIQPSIVDSNTVGWNENELNPLQIAGLNVVQDFSNQGSSGFLKSIDSIKNILGDENAALLSAAKLRLAQEAVGAQNVISRFGGGVVNPNLELLFTGPQLRPFNFNFRLSPRNASEAQEVKTIIRAFKQSMAAKRTAGLFLAAPNIFQIQYIQGSTNAQHPSLNRIKTCALKSCVVDYTPENSYMTFNDGDNTMVSYNLSLQFQELEPVTDADYAVPSTEGTEGAQFLPVDQIGY